MRKTESTVLPVTIKSFELPEDYIIYSLDVYYEDEDGKFYDIPYTKIPVFHLSNDKIYANIPDIADLDVQSFSPVPFFKVWYYKLRFPRLREDGNQYFIRYGRNVPDSIERQLNEE